MKFLKIGHYTNTQDATGLTVFLFDHSVPAAYLICGSSPASRELHTLEIDSNVDKINGLVLTGGSAFGLGAVDGVMRFLEEKSLGKPMPHGSVVPIVPAAAIYDLAVGAAICPTTEDAYQACLAAREETLLEGRVGAGTGASVGKVVPNTARMSGGLGVATRTLENGLCVTAYAVVNAVGDVYDQQSNIIAGARYPQGEFADCQAYLLLGTSEKYLGSSNTILVAVFTNAQFSKIELKRIAKMAVAGIARAIAPAFTRYDGDIIFTVSLGEIKASEVTVGTLAAEMVRSAIVNAVKESIIYDAK